jgi:hypothetical protein
VLSELDDLCSKEQLNALRCEDVVFVAQVGHGVVGDRVREVAELITALWHTLDDKER